MSDKPTVKELDLKLNDLVDWEGFALQLPEICYNDIEIIKRNNPNDLQGQKRALYDKWLRSYPDASWSDVIKALESPSVGENTIAKNIRDSYPDGMLPQRSEKISETSFPLSSADEFSSSTPCNKVIVPEDMPDKLEVLEDSFLNLTQDVKSAVEVSVSNGKLQLQKLKDKVFEQRTFTITELESVTTTDELFNVLRPHYNFLRCRLIIFIGKLLSGVIADRAKEYSERIKQFKHSTKVNNLKDMLKYHHPSSHHGNTVIVKIVVEDCWGEESLKLVEILVKTLFPVLEHSPDELQWFRVTSGSLVLSFIGSSHMTATLIEQSSAKIGFMKLVGIISLSIGDKVIWKQDELTRMFSLKNCLIQATLADNLEVAAFLLEHTRVDVNVTYDVCVLINVAEECFYTESEVIRMLHLYHKTFTDLLKDVEYYSPQLDPLESVLETYKNEQVVFHLLVLKNFLNDKILADHNLLRKHLPQLSYNIEVYRSKIALLKRQMVVKFLSGILPKFNIPQVLPTYTQIHVALQSAWGECSVHYIEQLGELAFSCSLFHEFQLIQVESGDDYFYVKFLAPSSSIHSAVDIVNRNANSCRLLGCIKILVDHSVLEFGGWHSAKYSFTDAACYAENCEAEAEVISLLKQLSVLPKDFKSIIKADDNHNYGVLLHPGSTPLIIACCKDNSDMVCLLLHYKANPNIQNNKNLTALMYSTGNTKLYKMLIDHGADVSARAFYKETTLYCACLVGNVQVVKLLLSLNHQLVHLKNNDGNLPLHVACHNGHIKVVQLLLEKKADPNIQDEHKGLSALMIASSKGYIKIVEQLLQEKVNVSLKDKEGLTALMLASCNGHFTIVELLLKYHSDPNVRSNAGATAFHLACYNGHIEVVELLLQAKSDPRAKDLKQHTPLQLACGKGHTAIVKRLLQIDSPKLNIDAQDSDNWTPLMIASRYGHFEVVQLLLKNRASLDFQSFNGWTALTLSCANGYLSIVENLLGRLRPAAQMTNLNIQSNDGFTALYLASKYGCTEIVKTLIQENVNLNICDNDGLTPLMIASMNGHADVTDLLLCQNVNPNTQSHKNECTALMLASIDCRNLAVVDRLLLSEADPNIQNKDGWTALMVASKFGQIQIVQRLVEKGANVNIQTNDGVSALMLANINRHLKIVKYLLEENADLNLQDASDSTVLMEAASTGNEEVFEWLIQKGASLDTQDNNGQSALHIACAKGHTSIVKCLLENNANPHIQDEKGLTALLVAICELIRPLYTPDDPNNMGARSQLTLSIDSVTTIFKLLLRENANPNAQLDVNGFTALFIACTFNLTAIVDCLLQYNADPNIQDNTGSTPLMIASKCGDETLVCKLLEAKANPNILNSTGESPLMSALLFISIVRKLLEYKADPNSRAIDGETPLIHACGGLDKIDVIDCLLQAKADPNAQDRKGITPLIAACRSNNPQIALRLLKEDIDVNVKVYVHAFSSEMTALLIASELGQEEVVHALLSKKNIDLNIQDSKGQTSLLIAIRFNRVEIAKCLINHQADVNIPDEIGRTPILEAFCYQHLDVFSLLLENHADPNIEDIKGASAAKGIHRDNVHFPEYLAALEKAK